MELSFWINANKIASNVAKTEVILFKTKHKIFDTEVKLELCRKQLHLSKSIKQLGSWYQNWWKSKLERPQVVYHNHKSTVLC